MIFKAAEDFKKRTLSALPSLLEKVAYICSLQTGSGGYMHWGFMRAYGNRPTQDAIYAAHMETALALSHAPVREIYQEYQEAVARSGSVADILRPGLIRAESAGQRRRNSFGSLTSASGFCCCSRSSGAYHSPSRIATPTTWPTTSASCGCLSMRAGTGGKRMGLQHNLATPHGAPAAHMTIAGFHQINRALQL